MLHERGRFLVDAELAPTRVRRLFQEALEQNPGGVPFLTFIDVNLPLTPNTSPIQRSWVQEAMKCFEERRRDGYAETDSGLILTNIGWHYHRDVGAPPAEGVTAKPETPLFPIRAQTWSVLEQALNEYGLIIDDENPPPRQVRPQKTTTGWFRYGYFVKGHNNSIGAAGESFARTPDTYKKGDSLGVRGGREGIVVAVVKADPSKRKIFDVMIVVEERIPRSSP